MLKISFKKFSQRGLLFENRGLILNLPLQNSLVVKKGRLNVSISRNELALQDFSTEQEIFDTSGIIFGPEGNSCIFSGVGSKADFGNADFSSLAENNLVMVLRDPNGQEAYGFIGEVE